MTACSTATPPVGTVSIFRRYDASSAPNALKRRPPRVDRSPIKLYDGVAGHYFGGGAYGDAEGLNVVDQSIILGRIRNLILGCDPLDREMKWKWLWVANIPEHVASAVDNAL